MQDRQLWRNFDWPLFLATITLTLIGVAMVYSATYNTEELVDYWLWQSLWLGLGLVALFAIAAFDYRHLEVLAPVTFLLLIGSLVAVAAFGDTLGTGAQRWINVGGTFVQPTEAGKFFLIIFMAWYLSRFRESGWTLPYLLGAMVLLIGPLTLVYLQPDLGMTIAMAFIGGTLILASGIPYWQLGTIVVMGVAALPFLQNTLQGYMLARICIYLNDEWLSVLRSLSQRGSLPAECISAEANQAASYNIEQALIAVGSGGWLGNGWASGTQNTLFFLRVRQSDYIFSVISEELGLLGASIVLLLLLFVVWRLLHIAESAQDLFGRLLAIGVAAVIFFQVVVNVGMNIGIVPVTGLTLPFISYGGSSLISMLFVIGLAQSVAMRHRKIEFA